MIVKLVFTSRTPLILPKSYNHLIQSFLYNCMDPNLSSLLHNFGFSYGKRRFKLFTFSKIIGKLLEKDLKRGLVIFERNITLYFASPITEVVSSSIKNLLKGKEFYLGKNEVSLYSLEIVKPKIGEEVLVRCLSPITVYKTPPGQRRFYYLNPWQREFYELIEKNLIRKYEVVYGKSYQGILKVEPLKVKEQYKKKILYKGTLIEAWEGYYKIRGKEEMVRLSLEAGLGAKNSQGFGMVEVV